MKTFLSSACMCLHESWVPAALQACWREVTASPCQPAVCSSPALDIDLSLLKPCPHALVICPPLECRYYDDVLSGLFKVFLCFIILLAGGKSREQAWQAVILCYGVFTFITGSSGEHSSITDQGWSYLAQAPDCPSDLLPLLLINFFSKTAACPFFPPTSKGWSQNHKGKKNKGHCCEDALICDKSI